MAKGKPKVKFPEQYLSEDEDARAARDARAKTPQARPHKRGGIHEVKDEDRTGTKWDTMGHKDMVAATRDPVYKPYFEKFKESKQKVKDLNKKVLLRTLGDAEKDLARKNRQAKKENMRFRKKATLQAKEEKEKRKAAQQRKQEDRLRKEEEGQILSDEEELLHELPLVYLHQEEESNISDTTSSQASTSPIYPTHRLRIFEWSFNDPPSSDYWRTPRSWPDNEELQPRQLPYTPMNVITMRLHEMLHIPGIDYKDHGTEPDHAPVLSQEVRDCARNGVLTGPLECAVIESGMDWSKRTTVQGWNGRMYFNLPRPDEDLAEVYREWKSNEGRTKRRMDRKPFHEAGAHKNDPALTALRKRERRKLTKKVYRASQWRPTLAYLPAYLPPYYEVPHRGPEANNSMHTIENLFYIRLKGESVPSFFFWADENEWKNPAKPNPEYEIYKYQHARRDVQSRMTLQRRLSTLIRVKKVPAPRRFLPTTKIRRATSRYKAVLWAIEREIYNNGLESTLKWYHDKCFSEGREDIWRGLITELRHQLPPSGRLPAHPPVRLERDPSMVSIAEKIARVEADDENSILPIYINDDWTRNDDAYWTTEECPKTPGYDDMNGDMQYAIPLSRSGRPVSRPDTPVPRLDTPGTPQSLHRRISDVFAWVSAVSHPGSQFYNAPSPTAPEQIREGTDLAIDILQEKAPDHHFRYDMWTMMQDRYRFQRQARYLCAICFEELGDIPLTHYEQHLLIHMAKIPFRCPFCNMEWDYMDGETKARHVRDHSRGDDTQAWLDYRREYPETWRRRLTQTPPELQGNTAVPRPNAHLGPRRSSVRFSPKTVEKRTAYNDSGNVGLGISKPGLAEYPTGAKTNGSDADISTWGSNSHRSSQSSQGSNQAAAQIPAKSSIKKKANLTLSTDANGRRKLEYELTNKEYMYRDAHDPRRRSSSNSLKGSNRDMRPYTYIDDGGGWDGSVYSDSYGESDSDGDGDGGRPVQAQRLVRGGRMRGGEVALRRVVELESEDEVEDGSEEEDDDQGERHDDDLEDREDDGSPENGEGEGQEEEEDSGNGDEGQNGKELDGHGSGGSEDDDNVSLISNSDIEEEENSKRRSSSISQQGSSAAGERGDFLHNILESLQPHSRKRPRRNTGNQPPNGFVSSSGVTRFKKRRTSGGEGNRSIKRPSVSPFTPSTPQSLRPSVSPFTPPSSRHQSRLVFPADGWEEWPAPASLWYNFDPNPDTVQQQVDDAETDVDRLAQGGDIAKEPGEMLDGLDMDDTEFDVDWLAQEERDIAEEPAEVLEGLDIEDAYILNSVKTATRPHIPHHLRHNQSPREPSEEPAGPSGRRSPSPSPSTSLTQAEDIRRNSAVPPNTSAVGVGNFPDRIDRLSPSAPGARSPGSRRSSQASEKRVSSSSGSNIPFKQRVRLRPGVKRRQDSEEDEPPVPEPRPVKPTRQRAKKDAQKPNQGKKNDIVPADNTEEETDQDAPLPNKSKPTKPIAAKKKTKPQEGSAEKAQKNAAQPDEDHETDEPSQGEPSESEQSGEQDVSEYQPARPGRKQAAKKKKKPTPASKKPPAKEGKQPGEKAPAKKTAKKRLTEAERLQAEADVWKKW